MLKRLLLCCCVLLAAACSTGEAQNEDDNPRLQPTVSPPPWVEADDVITLDNAPQITYLGRLDGKSTPSTVFDHAFSPDATRLAGLNNDQAIGWDLVTGDVIFTTARGQATRIFYAPDKTEIYTMDDTGKVNVHEADGGVFQAGFQGHPAYSGSAAFQRDLGMLALGGLNGEVKVWDPLTRESLVTFRAQELRVNALAFSPDGDLLATAGDERIAKVWNWQARTELGVFDVEGKNIVTLAFSPDGSQLAVGTTLDISLWSLADGTRQYILEIPVGGASEALLYSPDGKYLLSAGRNADASLWDPQTGELMATLPGVGEERTSVAFSPDGNMVVSSVLGGQVNLWDLTRITGTTVNQAKIDAGSQIYAVDWSSDGRLVALFDASGPVHLWGIKAQPPVEVPTPGA